MQQNIVEPGRPQMTIWHMCIGCWKPNAANTYSEYVIPTAFLVQNGCTDVPQYYIIHTFSVCIG